MIIFNTTYHIEDDVHDEVILFLKDEYIPAAMKTKMLSDPRLALIHAQHEERGSSYSLQFKVQGLEQLEEWMIKEGQELQADIVARFGQQACGFMTILEEIEL